MTGERLVWREQREGLENEKKGGKKERKKGGGGEKRRTENKQSLTVFT